MLGDKVLSAAHRLDELAHGLGEDAAGAPSITARSKLSMSGSIGRSVHSVTSLWENR